MIGAANQMIAPLFVFSIMIVRETVSYLLALFPGESVLWSLSFAMGHDFIHIQMVMDEWIGLGFAGNVTALLVMVSLLIYGCARNSRFIPALLCHLALVTLVMCALREWSAGNSGFFFDYDAKCILFYAAAMAAVSGCVHAHLRYIRDIRMRAVA